MHGKIKRSIKVFHDDMMAIADLITLDATPSNLSCPRCGAIHYKWFVEVYQLGFWSDSVLVMFQCAHCNVHTAYSFTYQGGSDEENQLERQVSGVR